MLERRPVQRWATQLCFRKTTPFWTNEMATPQTDTHVREQTRRDEQARKNGDAARAGVERLADFRQRATDDAWKSMESSVNAASQQFQNASDQFTRALGYSGEDGERLARQSGQNVEAITKFGTVLTQAYQDTSREWYGLAQKQLQRNLEGLSKLAHCRSVQDFAATQSGLVRESLRYMVEDAGSIVEISLRAVDEARRAVAGTAQESAAQGRPGAEKRVA
jgi:hypothetical protein